MLNAGEKDINHNAPFFTCRVLQCIFKVAFIVYLCKAIRLKKKKSLAPKKKEIYENKKSFNCPEI